VKSKFNPTSNVVSVIYNVLIKHQCYYLTTTPKAAYTFSPTYQAMTTAQSFTLDPFDYTQPTLASTCLTYSLVQTATDTPVVTASQPYQSYITISGLTLNVGISVAGSIGTLASQTYSFRVKAYNTYSGEIDFASHSITVNHECTGQTVTFVSDQFYTHTIGSLASSQSISSGLTLSTTSPAGVNCFTYSLIQESSTSAYTPPAYIVAANPPTSITIGPVPLGTNV
jgi:hypothetical protein